MVNAQYHVSSQISIITTTKICDCETFFNYFVNLPKREKASLINYKITNLVQELQLKLNRKSLLDHMPKQCGLSASHEFTMMMTLLSNSR